MKVYEYFDVENKQHIKAVQYFNRFGAFPDGFLHKGVDFATEDMKVVNIVLQKAGYGLTPIEDDSITEDRKYPLDMEESGDLQDVESLEEGMYEKQ